MVSFTDEDFKNVNNKIIKIIEINKESNNLTIKIFSNLSEHINTLYNWLAFMTAISFVCFIIIIIIIAKSNS